MLKKAGTDSIHVHMWQSVQQYVSWFRLRVLVADAIVDEKHFPFDPDGTHQLELVDELVCDSLYVMFLSACTKEDDWLGGCSTEVNASAKTSSCGEPEPPSIPSRPPNPPLLEPLTRPPPSSSTPLVPTIPISAGCKDPDAATYDAGAVVDDPSLCLLGIWGCTLPTALNHQRTANLNDGSCDFSSSRCAATLVAQPFWVKAGKMPWSASVNTSADGSRPCRISPSVSYDRCISVTPPVDKSRDVVVSFLLPSNAMEVTVEVGLDPHAGRLGNAEFELRAVTKQGQVVASDIAVRKRLGLHSLPSVLRVNLVERQASVVQLIVNDEDGSAIDDLAVWADPLVYCEGKCPCLFAHASDQLLPQPVPPDELPSHGHLRGLDTVVKSVFCVIAVGLCVVSAIFSWQRRAWKSGWSRSRVIGSVQMVRRDDAVRLALIDENEGSNEEDGTKLSSDPQECIDSWDDHDTTTMMRAGYGATQRQVIYLD